jgi:hypothetical protein
LDIISVSEFIESLDKTHPGHEGLAIALEVAYEHERMPIVRKGSDLPEVIQELCNDRRWPIVDKTLGAAFGVRTHLWLRIELFRYHFKLISPNSGWINPRECSDLWLENGWGYFISSMNPRAIVVHPAYWPDKFDHEVFATFVKDLIPL